MNYSIIINALGKVLGIEAIFLILPFLVGLIYREKEAYSFLIVAFLCLILSYVMTKKKVKNRLYFTKEGLLIVSLSWISMSVLGALPFIITREIPSFTDSLFETVSGFTTTGASILHDVTKLSHASLMWRSFTHWIGGMGVIVFMIALLPDAHAYDIHLMRAESPGPSVGKLVPHIKETAKVLYLIYIGLTLSQIIFLIIFKMPVFDALTTTFATAGTGGFGIKADSIASYSSAIKIMITIFMILFGVNFNFYFILLLSKRKKDIFKLEEVFIYLMLILFSILLIAYNIRLNYKNMFYALEDASFQVASIITTTGFATVDFNLWPNLSKTILLFLMFIGACAGSTGGGIKVSRIIIVVKNSIKDILKYIYPNSVRVIKLDKRVIGEDLIRSVHAFLGIYTLIFVFALFIISFDGFDLVTNFSAVAATFNNIGPGFNMVGPASNFASFSVLSKIVLVFVMLAGRLEIYPMLILFVLNIWKFRKR